MLSSADLTRSGIYASFDRGAGVGGVGLGQLDVEVRDLLLSGGEVVVELRGLRVGAVLDVGGVVGGRGHGGVGRIAEWAAAAASHT